MKAPNHNIQRTVASRLARFQFLPLSSAADADN